MNKKDVMYVCDKCGKPAVYNLQNVWVLYDIVKDKDFKENDTWEGDTNEFFCEDCYNMEK